MLIRKMLVAGVLTAALLAPALAAPGAHAQDATTPPITIRPLGTYSTGQLDAAAAEIVAYHAGTQRAYVVNGGDKPIGEVTPDAVIDLLAGINRGRVSA